jgi:GT2 family glycosyltransferase
MYMKRPLVSVIIVVKNDLGIEPTLELVTRQQTTAPYEIIVIDASASGRLAGIRARFPQVRWEMFDQAGRRFTIAEQRNRGLELAQGEIIAFIDASCAPVPGWLEAIVTAMNDGEDVVCGPCRNSNPHNLVHYFPEYEQRRHIREYATMNLAFRRRVIDKVGRFDPIIIYGEDVDYSWRVTDAGYQICYDPGAAIAHDFGQAEEQFRRAFRYGKARAMLHKKHWRRRLWQLLRFEPHVWMYPLMLVSLPLALLWPWYLAVVALALVVLALKNRSVTTLVHHFTYAWGVLVGLVTASS